MLHPVVAAEQLPFSGRNEQIQAFAEELQHQKSRATFFAPPSESACDILRSIVRKRVQHSSFHRGKAQNSMSSFSFALPSSSIFLMYSSVSF